jgi:hypothetical protein
MPMGTAFTEENGCLLSIRALQGTPITGLHGSLDNLAQFHPLAIPPLPFALLSLIFRQQVFSASLTVCPDVDRPLAIAALLASLRRWVLHRTTVGTGRTV